MLETGDHSKIKAHTPLGFVEFKTDADINLFKKALATRVLDGVSHAVFASPHSIIAKSLVAQCVIAFLEDFAPKDYSLAKLLDHVSASKIPAEMPIILKVALHFRSDGLLSGKDPVLWAGRIREPAFRDIATQQPATAELLGLDPEIKTTGVALFKEIWDTTAWREKETPAPEGVEHSISRRINSAIKSRCIKKAPSRIKPRRAQPAVKPESITDTTPVVTKPKPAQLKLPPVQAAGTPKLPPKPKAPTKPKAPPAQPTPKPTQGPKPRPEPVKPDTPPPATAASVTPPNPEANQTPIIVQASKVSEKCAPKTIEPPPMYPPVIEPTPPTAAGNAQPPPLPETPPRLNRDQIYDLLMNARQKDWVELCLDDGRSLSGAIIFNEFKGTGRLINVDDEFAYDFNVDQVLDVKY